MRFSLNVTKTLLCLWLLVGLAFTSRVQATHLRAGEITVERENCNSYVFRITITVYTNTASSVLFGGRDGEEDILDFGDGTTMLVPETENTLRPDLGTNIGTASYSVTHTYRGAGTYLISYREPNRNEGVLNMDNSVNTRFYIETQIKIDPYVGCDNSPILQVAPIDQACSGVAFFHNPGAVDEDGDSLSYELVVPYSDRNTEVVRYQDPSDNSPRTFYTGDYNTSNEAGDGPPTFSIDTDGTLLWDAPGLQGEYNVAFVIREWRKIDGVYVSIGYVRRDMQILVNECDNERPDLELPADTCVVAGTTLEATIIGTDPDGDDVKIEAYSEVFNLADAEYPATYSPTAAFSSSPYELDFTWETKCLHVRSQPYQVVFKITDNPDQGVRLATYRTWNITVVGPKPEWESLTVSGGTATLDWEDYTCDNAELIQVWRRVDSYPYDPGNCETGMLDFLGYELIDTVPVSDESRYEDDNGGAGLAPGATYCYRLVAIFPSPEGGESYMSDEMCIDVIADAPVITNVTVNETSETDGEIGIRWVRPLDLDPNEEFSYEVYRGEGVGSTPSVAVFSGTTLDTFAIDAGLDTENKIYNYWVVAYDELANVVDTSATAASVRLEASSQISQIELTWSAEVPWSNNSVEYPMHHIYRGASGATSIDDLDLIDSVDVTLNGFVYTDAGQYNGVALEDEQEYCYCVMTKGVYGNDDIEEPFLNYSQIICAQPSDSIPPCQVELPVVIDGPDCSDDECNRNVFSNEISWERPNTGDCQNDISYYNIYVSSTSGGDYVILDQTTDTDYVDENLSSYARCYKVSAVDRSGNEGPLSEEICIDNCPRYKLPNVFTPNNDNCNDVFSAFNDDESDVGENGSTDGCTELSTESIKNCARFVESVVFKVFNRWGKEVYDYSSGGERTIYINWDGKDKNGNDLATGIYYYVAEVTFDSVYPSVRHQTFKGWVQILR